VPGAPRAWGWGRGAAAGGAGRLVQGCGTGSGWSWALRKGWEIEEKVNHTLLHISLKFIGR
jgi:hypothetical protein